MKPAYRPLDLALFLGVMLVWGANFAVAKTGLQQLPPILFMALRFALVALLLAPFVKVPWGRMKAIFGISMTLGLLHFSLMFIGLTKIDAATAAIAIQLQVPFASLLAAVFFKDMLGWRRALGMAIAFLGVAVIAGEPRLEGNYLYLGLVIGAACIWSVANVQIKKMGNVNGTVLNAWMAIFATPQLFLASWLLEEGQWAALAAADAWAYFAVVYQSVFVVVIGYGVWLWLLRRYELNQAMPMMLLVPVIGVASGVIFLGEELTPAVILGGLLTIAGVGIIIARRPKVAAPEAERL